MRVLVTGGGGFLGFHIVKQLIARGDEVLVIGRNHYSKVEKAGAKSVAVDICNLNELEPLFKDVEEVYHVAALASLWGDWDSFYQTNFVGTKNVVLSCLSHNVKRLIYTSSPSVIFNGQSQKGLDESTHYPSKWLAHYPHTKMLAEKLVLENNCDQLQTVALRPHLIWGPGDPHLFPRLVEKAKLGKLAIVGSGQNKVDIIFVENVVKGHLQAAEFLKNNGKPAVKAYFLGQDEPVNLWTFINEILHKENLPPVKKRISFNLAYFMGACLEEFYQLLHIKTEPKMTRFIACQLSMDHYYSHKNAQKDFAYNPSITVKQGLDKIYNSVPKP